MSNAKPLIIAEKPSAARAIAEALGGFSRRSGYMESRDYLLSWAVGHLVELMAPEDYDSRLKRWSLATLPILPTTFGLKVTEATRSQWNTVATLARQAPELINACDAAREGELIFRYICQTAGVDKPVRRLWVSSLTREAIRRAFDSMRPESDYDRLYRSALCRAQGDWLVGMNMTRACTVKWGELYSVGRVQTPTLALIVQREREIQKFTAESYWEVRATFSVQDEPNGSYQGKWFDKNGDRLSSEKEALAVVERVRGQAGRVEAIRTKPTVERSPLLYDLTSLQRDANRRFGMTAAATLKSAQGLYEAKLITYPRTDSRYLSQDLLKELPLILGRLKQQPTYGRIAENAGLGRVHAGNRRVVDDRKVSDHHAIIPTAEIPTKLTAAESKVYDLIVRRFLAQFYPDARFLDTEVITQAGPALDRFRTRGRQMLDPGWRVVEPRESRTKKKQDDELQVIPPLKSGASVHTGTIEPLAKKTKPPKRYTEATLLSAMEFAGRELEDEALKEAMKGRGLGTPATRASIIERLKKVGYVALEKRALVPTEKGRHLVELVEGAGVQVLLSPELTGEWEQRIADIQQGKYQADRFMQEIRLFTIGAVEAVRESPSGSRSGVGTGDKVQAGRCPACGKPVVRTGSGWLCTGKGCSVRIPTWLCGKVIDQSLAGTILRHGKSRLISGFKSHRTGKTFSAYLVLKDNKVEFQFPKSRAKRRRRSGTGAVGKQ